MRLTTRGSAAAPFLLAAGLLVPAGAAAAQDPSSVTAPRIMSEWRIPADSDRRCTVFAVESRDEGVKAVHARCNGHGVVLGQATAFETITNEALGATLVDLRLGSARRVLLLTLDANGYPVLEDLSGQVALAAGRSPMSEIDGVELDLKRFSVAGAIGVRGRPEDQGARRSERIELGQQVAIAQARFAERATQVEE